MNKKHFIRLLSVHARKHGLMLIRAEGLRGEKSLEIAKAAVCELAHCLDVNGDDLGVTMCFEEKIIVWAKVRP